MVEVNVANGGHHRLSPEYCREKHWHRYLVEFDFRSNNRSALDKERANKAVMGANNKRLTYRQSDSKCQPAWRSQNVKK
jgi:hypothetical protein